MVNITTIVICVLVVLVFIAEIYKITFERRMESQDERGQMFILKIKSLSYTVLTVGILAGVALVAIFKLIDKEYFIYYVMLVFFIQSIASSIYLAIVRKV
ncbi:hypothetical protein AM501_30845 [Aneurinibacillus migulanus]|uniref:DUF3784 domain-containing protein n=1 Tax=Aneurinibacillus migulanus TaxID=47500 RepID=A0A0D1USN2_ANEMI|nr:hypothetical protein [Aneurinibacillus migulanus]KIV49974.1 hypothetical protein TS65_31050 [Aneurinibacillus migulanus]KIV54632.1 hypothetical protein TS64_16635 [Aneurinibacillus migulanus]KON97771.1 hypothetical protein AF333_22390 [Aneurinibacillus migulanus]KPD04613.1 hypothetical protein AM501_30845 [Aneurinibacillus migulanus]MED0894632.1 hypothetical protein [Aneurinibacillus migulanus]